MKELVMTMGLPASGKSTISRTLYEGFSVIDPDQIKEHMDGYNPAHPEKTHERSAQIAEMMFQQAMIDGWEHVLVDGTGSNVERMIRRINQAKGLGYMVTLLYVDCPLSVCIERNRERARVVPEHVIRQKAEDIETALEVISRYVNRIVVIRSG